MVWKGDSRGRLAGSLVTLIDQVDAKWPGRSRVSDGSIGDAAHQARTSDHNLGDDGVVEALDVTHDPARGPDTWQLAEVLRKNRDPRIKYVISNGRIFAGPDGPQPWVWRAYDGDNKHAVHVHVSVRKTLMDDPAPWALTASGPVPPAPPAPSPKGVTEAMRRRMAEAILSYEKRVDSQGRVVVHYTAAGAEIAGVTQASHPEAFARLKAALDSGDQKALGEAALKFCLGYTDQARNWTDRAGLEFVLRDCLFHRGPRGAADILQTALGLTLDGQVGPTTRGALAALSFDQALARIRQAREAYEDAKYGRRETLRAGLVSRWDRASAQARVFQKEQGYVVTPEGAAATVVVGAGSGAVAAVQDDTWTAVDWFMAAFVIGTVAAAAFLVIRKSRRKVP